MATMVTKWQNGPQLIYGSWGLDPRVSNYKIDLYRNCSSQMNMVSGNLATKVTQWIYTESITLIWFMGYDWQNGFTLIIRPWLNSHMVSGILHKSLQNGIEIIWLWPNSHFGSRWKGYKMDLLSNSHFSSCYKGDIMYLNSNWLAPTHLYFLVSGYKDNIIHMWLQGSDLTSTYILGILATKGWQLGSI